MMNDTANNNRLDAVQENARATGKAFETLANTIAQRAEFAPIAKRARERAAELAANKFTLMVVGEFKRGKSTLLNAMLGARVLPVKLTPCTAIVTFLRHGPEPKALVAFSDDRTPNPDVLSLDEFEAKYQLSVDDTRVGGAEMVAAAQQEISDRFGPVEDAVIQYPSPFVENGVELVDTPGLNENDTRTRRVFLKLPTADAIIMVLDAVTVCNQNEIHFIEHRLRPLGLHKHVFFVINRWNLVLSSVVDPDNPREVEETFAEQMRFINSRLVPFVSAAGSDKVDKRIFKVDALGALRQRLKGAADTALEMTEIPAFEHALREFLAADRDAVRRGTDVRTADDIEREVTRNVGALVRTIRAPIASFEAEHDKLNCQLEQLRRIKGNIESIIRANAAATAEALGHDFEAYLSEKLSAQLTTDVADFDLGELESVWTQYKLLPDPFRAEKNKISKRIETHLQQQVSQLFTRYMDEWRDERMDPELKVCTADLLQRLRYEAGEYVKVLSEITGDSKETAKLSDREISRKIAEWLRSYHPGFTTVVSGAGVDLTLMAGIVGDVVLHGGNMLLGNVLLPGVGLLASGIFALARTEWNKGKTKKQIVEVLEGKRQELLHALRKDLEASVEGAFDNLSEPISKSIAAEIDVLARAMTDVLASKQQADFDADAFEGAAHALEAAVKTNVREIHQLAA